LPPRLAEYRRTELKIAATAARQGGADKEISRPFVEGVE